MLSKSFPDGKWRKDTTEEGSNKEKSWRYERVQWLGNDEKLPKAWSPAHHSITPQISEAQVECHQIRHQTLGKLLHIIRAAI